MEIAHDLVTDTSRTTLDQIRRVDTTAPADIKDTTTKPHFGILNALNTLGRPMQRLILCFDGTGNSFKGNSSDTNIVKLYQMFDRSASHQMHYYQPGIGTFPADGSGKTSTLFGKVRHAIAQGIDQAFATSFDSHVMAGYRFLLQFYHSGDRIYIFGFSRGAFTARFLARMVSEIGLLSAGNEELVPFAYKNYLDYELGNGPKELPRYLRNFNDTFSRHDPPQGLFYKTGDVGIRIYFLGLFDTVNSVGLFDVPWRKNVSPPMVHGTAQYVRHAMAIDERRVKFKPALLSQDVTVQTVEQAEDVKEVWFTGNHCDIGGGYPAVKREATRGTVSSTTKKSTNSFGQRVKRVLLGVRDTRPSEDVNDDAFQLSDIALKWMIDELDMLPDDQIVWDKSKESFLNRFRDNYRAAITSTVHDTLSFGGGSNAIQVLLWNLLEYLPFIKRWVYVEGKWRYISFPVNAGSPRDIPYGATFQHSAIERLHIDETYRPGNQTWPKRSKTSLPLCNVGTGVLDEKMDDAKPDGSFVKRLPIGGEQADNPTADGNNTTAAPNNIFRALHGGPNIAHFELYATHNKGIGQIVVDDTYQAVATSGEGHATRAV